MDFEDLDSDPHVQFGRWFSEAAAAGVRAPEQMALATAGLDAVPSVRMVLLKGHDARGFVFYTNDGSRKATELAANPRAAAVLYWEPLRRQVRVEGRVEPVGADEAATYFATRPRASQVGAWASPQSRALTSRADLDRLVAETERRFAGDDDLPRPPFWGGYRITPTAIEFWQGQPDRLHDRVRYEPVGGSWRRERLAP